MYTNSRLLLGTLPLMVLLVSGTCFMAYGCNSEGEDSLGERDCAYPFRNAVLGCEEEEALGKGDDFTGVSAAWLLAVANLPALLSLLIGRVARFASLKPVVKEYLTGFNRKLKKYLMPFHYWINLLGALMAFIHLGLSRCGSVTLPEWAIGIMTVLVVTGVLIKIKRTPGRIRKVAYQIHTHPLSSGLFLIFLIVGHWIID